MNLRKKTICILATFPIANGAIAAVSAEEAAKLGGEQLTGMGSERAGNADGSIPAYSGEGIAAPASYDPAKSPGRRPDPFSNEKPLYSITAQNADRHAARLGGLIEMFKKYPNYRMDIYPTHRTNVLPKYILENTKKNATSCKAIRDGLVLEGCYAGMPFPFPKTGNEVMWNKITAYVQHSWAANVDQYIVSNNGKGTLINGTGYVEIMDFYDPARKTPWASNDVFWKVRLDFSKPTRSAGEKLVIIDSLNTIDVGRRAYSYLPGQRRVKLLPDLAFDTPNPTAGGSSTMDDAQGFNGPLTRFDYKLVGKKERFIPYNNFKINSEKSCAPDSLLTQNFPKPDCLRWELHRTWEVEATLKPAFRHIYKKRIFNWDEDGYSAGITEDYDAGGSLYRIVTPVGFTFYGGGITPNTYFIYDLRTGQWAALGTGAHEGGGEWPIPPKPERYYSPEALAGEGIR